MLDLSNLFSSNDLPDLELHSKVLGPEPDLMVDHFTSRLLHALHFLSALALCFNSTITIFVNLYENKNKRFMIIVLLGLRGLVKLGYEQL